MIRFKSSSKHTNEIKAHKFFLCKSTPEFEVFDWCITIWIKPKSNIIDLEKNLAIV